MPLFFWLMEPIRHFEISWPLSSGILDHRYFKVRRLFAEFSQIFSQTLHRLAVIFLALISTIGVSRAWIEHFAKFLSTSSERSASESGRTMGQDHPKCKETPLTVNVINFEFFGFNVSIWVPWSPLGPKKSWYIGRINQIKKICE